jgi:glucosamine-6-phosphate deaminase
LSREMEMPRIVRCESEAHLGELAARALAEHVGGCSACVVGLPTGRTAEPVYRALAQMCSAGRFDPSSGLFFALDEVVCLSGHRPFLEFLRDRFLSPCGIDPARFEILDPTLADGEIECRRYESEIRQRGGFGIVLLGIGRNGHIAFNEPCSGFESVTRRVELTGETRETVAAGFGLAAGDIAGALTVGIATIMHSKRVLLLAAGAEKARALRDALSGTPDPSCPATALARHRDVTVIADAEALTLVE